MTDAALVLGYLAADNFLGGEIQLDAGRARVALERVGRPLGLDATAAAQAVFRTVNSFMADQITEISTRRGYDARDFVLVAGGGAGPTHAAFLADLLGITTVVVPHAAALYSALGMLVMDVGQDYARTRISPAASLDLAAVNGLFADMEAEARTAFGRVGARPEDIRFRRTADMRYHKQFHEIEVECPDGPIGPEDLSQIVEGFHRRHEELYTFCMRFRAVDMITYRLHAVVPRQTALRLQLARDGRRASGRPRRRTALFDAGPTAVPVHDGPSMAAGERVTGPAIVEEPDTTVVVPPRFACTVDADHNYVLTRGV